MDQVFARDIEAIRWFSAVGDRLPAFSIPTVAVASKAEALAHCSDSAWGEVTLEARNRLTEFLCMRYRERDAQWNVIAESAKAQTIAPLVKRVWQPYAERHDLGKVFVDCVSWDVLAAIMEHEYRDCTGRPVFFLQLLEVYRTGHFPCGWAGEWPAGLLLAW